jgi:glycosyltransferase involved in cell wall biosynthesis
MTAKQEPISIIVPTLNEAENVALLFKRIDATLTPRKIPYELIIIDDHSTDGTLEILRAAARSKHVRLFIKQGKPGKAYSLLEGFAHARFNIICMIDADLQYPPEAIAGMYADLHKKHVDIVISERVELHTPLFRRLSSKVFQFVFAKLLFGINYDTQSGLKLFRKHVIESILLTPSPWSFDLEFIVRSLEHGYTLSSRDIIFAERHSGRAKINVFKATFELAYAAIQLRRVTHTKRLKRNYKHNLEHLRSPAIAVLMIGMLAIVSIMASTHQVSALALTPPTITPASVVGDGKQLLGAQTTSVQSAQNQTTVAGSSAGATTTMSTESPVSVTQSPAHDTIVVSTAAKAVTSSAATNASTSVSAETAVNQSGVTSPAVYRVSKLSSHDHKALVVLAEASFAGGLIFLLLAAVSHVFIHPAAPVRHYNVKDHGHVSH